MAGHDETVGPDCGPLSGICRLHGVWHRSLSPGDPIIAGQEQARVVTVWTHPAGTHDQVTVVRPDVVLVEVLCSNSRRRYFGTDHAYIGADLAMHY